MAETTAALRTLIVTQCPIAPSREPIAIKLLQTPCHPFVHCNATHCNAMLLLLHRVIKDFYFCLSVPCLKNVLIYTVDSASVAPEAEHRSTKSRR